MEKNVALAVRSFSEKQIEILQLLVEIINDNENLRTEYTQKDILLTQYSKDLEAAQVLIQKQDDDLKEASRVIKNLTLEKNTLKQELQDKDKLLESYEKKIAFWADPNSSDRVECEEEQKAPDIR